MKKTNPSNRGRYVHVFRRSGVGSIGKRKPETTAEPGSTAAPDVADFDKRMETIQADMRKMEDQMKEIQTAQDTDTCEHLLQERWDVMRDTMRLTHDPQGPGPLGCCVFGRQGGRRSPMGSGRSEGSPLRRAITDGH